MTFHESVAALRRQLGVVTADIKGYRAQFNSAKTDAFATRLCLKEYGIKAMTYAVPEYGPERTRLEKNLAAEVRQLNQARCYKLKMRPDARHLCLALAFLHGTHYDACEKKVAENGTPDPASIYAYLKAYGHVDTVTTEQVSGWLAGTFLLEKPAPKATVPESFAAYMSASA